MGKGKPQTFNKVQIFNGLECRFWLKPQKLVPTVYIQIIKLKLLCNSNDRGEHNQFWSDVKPLY